MRILIVGAPATGKSTLARSLSKELGLPVRLLDDLLAHLKSTRGYSPTALLTDSDLEIAAIELMREFCEAQAGIFELCHHDYSELLSACSAAKCCNLLVIIRAPHLSALLERNDKRGSPEQIPPEYISRANCATERLVDSLESLRLRSVAVVIEAQKPFGDNLAAVLDRTRSA